MIEAFDQPWKRALEGTVGGYWGIFDRATGGAEIQLLGGSVSDHPHWPLQALAGIVLAALTFGGAAWAAGRGGKASAARICGPGSPRSRFVPAVLFGWTIETVPVESFSLGSWLRSLAFAADCRPPPRSSAPRLAPPAARCRLRRALGGSGERRDGLDWALGGAS